MSSDMNNLITTIYSNKLKEFNLTNKKFITDINKLSSDNKSDLLMIYGEKLDMNENKIKASEELFNNKIDTIKKLDETILNQNTAIKTNKSTKNILENISETEKENTMELNKDLLLNKDKITKINEKYIFEDNKTKKFIKQIKILSIILIVLIVVYLFLL